MNRMHWTQTIDRRILYAILLALIIIGLIVPIPLPLVVGPQARALYDAVEAAPQEKLALVCTNWSASTQGENRPQTEVILRHLMRRHVRFALMAFDQQSTNLARELAEELAPEYKYEYGKDWVNWGYRADVNGTLKGIVQSIPDTFKTESHNRVPLTDLGKLPVMQGVRNTKDLGLIVEISPSGVYKAWIQFVVGSTPAKFGYGPTSVMAPELYNYIDAGQMAGMMFGIKGAAEYEKLLIEDGTLKKAGFTTKAIAPVSLSLVLLFILIGLGNYGMYASRKGGEEVQS
jgi:hypothetical protein